MSAVCKGNLRVISLNVRGLNNRDKCEKLFQWFKDSGFHVIFLQETYFTKSKADYITKLWSINNAIHVYSDSPHSRGVSVLFNPSCDVEIIDVHKSEDARRLVVNVNVQGTVISLINVYAPNKISQRKDYYNKLSKCMTTQCLNDSMIIMAGDFNCCLTDQDRTPVTHEKDQSRVCLNNLLIKHDLCDSGLAVMMNPPFTWQNGEATVKSRLDYIFVSNNLKKCVRGIDSEFFISNKTEKRLSDHKYVRVTLSNIISRRGPGYWKLNTMYITDNEYRRQISSIISNVRHNSVIKSKRLLWEMLKIEIKQYSMAYAVRKHRERRDREKVIIKELAQFRSTEGNDTALGQVKVKEELLEELDEIYSVKTKGLQIRAKEEWIEYGEKSNIYFFRLEKSRQSNNVINKLVVNGREIKDRTGVQKALEEFYKKLYSSTSVEDGQIKNYVESISVPRLNKIDQNQCDGQITKQELSEIVSGLKNSKSPGIDGLPAEFYKAFWSEIEEVFLGMLEETFQIGELPHSLKRAIITLVYKKGEKDNIENYRPISLCNLDYKIIAGVLAKRMQKVLFKIISPDQTGYIKGRFIGTSTRLIQDILEYAEKNNIAGALLMLDFRKAFDSVEHGFILAALKHFGFGNSFCKGFKFSIKVHVSMLKMMDR